MTPVQLPKQIDRSKINIGTECECFVVYSDTFALIDREASQQVLHSLIKDHSWEVAGKPHKYEIHEIKKTIHGLLYTINLDVSYAIFELTSPPVGSLEDLEALHVAAFTELRAVLSSFNMTIWPFSVAPASSGLLPLPHDTKEEVIDDTHYKLFSAQKNMTKFCHMTSQQVSIDVPHQKIVPTINALYKNLGTIIDRFANGRTLKDGILYNEGRYYWWLDSDPAMQSSYYENGVNPFFPHRPFENLNDYFGRTWKSEHMFVMRNGHPYFVTDPTMTIHRFITEKKALAADERGQAVEVSFTRDDIELMFLLNWTDFKMHFDFADTYAMEDFMHFYTEGNMDGFFDTFCTHAWIEVRPCSPHYENNAMDIPRYFYDIFQDLDAYIEASEQISWEEAWRARDRAIGYPEGTLTKGF